MCTKRVLLLPYCYGTEDRWCQNERRSLGALRYSWSAAHRGDNPLAEIPAFGELTAWTVVAELGLDVDAFRTPERAASWSGFCPGIAKSAGTREHGPMRQGDWTTDASASGMERSKHWIRRDSIRASGQSPPGKAILRSLYWQISSRFGPKERRIATTRKQLKIAFLIIRYSMRY
jgi:hypothetical protein